MTNLTIVGEVSALKGQIDAFAQQFPLPGHLKIWDVTLK